MSDDRNDLDPPDDDEPISPEDEAVLVELERLQEQQTGSFGTILILGISVVLFIAVARGDHGADLWILIPVLAFHELGHYVAMRLFGYRNLRMFFIPFFGAAVSGRNYNVEGWKKAIVALMGPLPGIVLGAFLGIAGWALHVPMLTAAAFMLLFLNGFNLLPFLPLDGGWVLHAVLFVRHPVLDLLFRLVTALCLLGISLLLGAYFLVAVAGFMLLGLPLHWRMANVAQRLRQGGVSAVSRDAQTIPDAAALDILAEVRPALPPNTTAKVLAQYVASTFESLNAEPPGVLASFGLLALHAWSFVFAIGMTIALVILQGPPGGNVQAGGQGPAVEQRAEKR